MPNPQYTWQAGDTIQLDMKDNKGYINGNAELTPIAYGSQNIKIPPGQHEVLLTVSGEPLRNAIVTYREAFR